jgi:hypothetical protein
MWNHWVEATRSPTRTPLTAVPTTTTTPETSYPEMRRILTPERRTPARTETL